MISNMKKIKSNDKRKYEIIQVTVNSRAHCKLQFFQDLNCLVVDNDACYQRSTGGKTTGFSVPFQNCETFRKLFLDLFADFPETKRAIRAPLVAKHKRLLIINLRRSPWVEGAKDDVKRPKEPPAKSWAHEGPQYFQFEHIQIPRNDSDTYLNQTNVGSEKDSNIQVSHNRVSFGPFCY